MTLKLLPAVQELVTHVSEAVTQVKAERKRREGLESKVRAAHEARTEALAAAAKASDQLKCVLVCHGGSPDPAAWSADHTAAHALLLAATAQPLAHASL